MSQENIQIVSSLYDVAGGDWFRISASEIDRAFRDYIDEQVFEIHLPSDYPEGEPVFRGREGFAEMLAMLGEAWGKWRIEAENFHAAGDRVVAFARILAEGGSSGVPIEVETAHIWTIRGGRVTSMHAYRDRTEALEAAGLRE
jgi:ketosteroid isomerase-like protein